MPDKGDIQACAVLGAPGTWLGTSSYVYMDTLCFSWYEIIPIDEFDHSVNVNAKESDRVDVHIYMLQVSNWT